MSSENVELRIAKKLADAWSANSIVDMLSESTIAYLASPERWSLLVDPTVRTRLLLAPLYLRPTELRQLQPSLMKLKALAEADKDEWVRTIGAAVGPYDGRLHFDHVLRRSPLIQATIQEVRRRAVTADPRLFRPLEEKYLSGAALQSRLPGWREKEADVALPLHSHFVRRDPSLAPRSPEIIKQRAMDTSLPQGHGRASSGGPGTAAAAAAAGVSKTTLQSARALATTSAAMPVAGRMGVEDKRPVAVDAFETGGSRRAQPPLPRQLGVKEAAGKGSDNGGSSSNSMFMPRKPGGLVRRLGGGLAGSGTNCTANAAGPGAKKKAALLDVGTVAQLTRKAAEDRERAQREQEQAREEAMRQKLEAKAAEKAAREAAKSQREEEIKAAKEAAKAAREAQRAQKEEKTAAAAAAKKKKKAVESLQTTGDERNDETSSIHQMKRAAGKLESDGKHFPVKSQKRSATATAGAIGTRPINGVANDISGALEGVAAGQLAPEVAAAALHHASMLSDAAAAGLELDPDLLAFMQYQGGGAS